MGYGVVVTLYQSPTEHWGRMFVEGINLVLQIMAIVALIMSVILVFNSMNALITQQTNQIGIIKAAGGRVVTIVTLYLSSVFIYGSLALLIALPLSAISAYALSGWFLNLFNIEVASFQVSGTAIVLQIIAAIGVPLLAALWPVLRGASMSVREAISTYGIGSDFGSGRLDALIERFGAMMLPASYAAALGNIFRRKGRLSLTLFVLVVAGTMFLIIMSLISSTNLTLDNEMARQAFDFRIGFSSDHDIREVLDLVDDAGVGQEAELWYSRNATMLRDGEQLLDSAGLGAQLLGLPVDNAMYKPIITSGRWLEPDETSGIVISQDTAETNQITVGDAVTIDLGELGDSQWEVVGTYRVVYGTGFNTEAIYAGRDAVLEAVNQRDRGTQLLVRTGLESLEENRQASEDLQDLLEQQGFNVDFYTTNIKLEQRAFADNQFASVTSMLLSLAILVAAVGGIGLMGSLGTSVVERTREIGVMRAVGAQSRTITGLFVTEGVIQGLISWLLAIPLSLILARPLARQLGQTMIEVDLDYAFNGPAVIIWLATILFIALLSSIIPAHRAALISVRESLAYA
jgi:putative ABC transport system permease protein